MPRGKALGAAWYLPEERQRIPAQALLDQICSLMAGRAAEDYMLGSVATGALNDLERATKIAYALVVYYGMSDKLPNISYYDSTGQGYGFSKPYSDDRARIIDEEVSRILAEQYQRAKDILAQYHDGLKQLADELYTREVIFTADVEAIFGKRAWLSRTNEIISQKNKQIPTAEPEPDKKEENPESPSDSADGADNDNDATPPPFHGL